MSETLGRVELKDLEMVIDPNTFHYGGKVWKTPDYGSLYGFKVITKLGSNVEENFIGFYVGTSRLKEDSVLLFYTPLEESESFHCIYRSAILQDQVQLPQLRRFQLRLNDAEKVYLRDLAKRKLDLLLMDKNLEPSSGSKVRNMG